VIHDLSLSFLAACDKETREYIELLNSEKIEILYFSYAAIRNFFAVHPYRQAFELNPKHPLTLNPKP
jgi:hypothetical protein